MIVVSIRTTPLPLLFAILSFFAIIGPHKMRLLQDKIPVIDQTAQPQQWTKQQLQQSITNRHVIHETVLHGHLLHSISPTITTLTLFISNLHNNINEPYGRVVHPVHDDMSKVNQDDSRRDSTNAPQVAASGSGGDDEEDPYKKKPNNDGYGEDKTPTDDNDDEEEDDNYYEPGNAFIGEVVDVLESDNPDDFSNITFDDDMDIVLDEIVEVGVVDEIEDEDMVGLWEEESATMKQATLTGNA